MGRFRQLTGTLLGSITLLCATVLAAADEPLAPGTVFRDCPGCPEMIVIPPGSFQMGSTRVEPMRGGEMRPNGPVRQVTVPRPLAVGRYEVTNAEYGEFVAATGRPAQSCRAWGLDKNELGFNWRDPGLGRLMRDDEPVVCVFWNDAQAYVAWLSAATGQSYRLLSEAEWEYAAKAGGSSTWPWGEDAGAICEHANVLDADGVGTASTLDGSSTTAAMGVQCSDGYAQVAPVGHFKPNAFGLYDMVGNVWEWTQDCSFTLYPPAPVDGTAVEAVGDCEKRAVRGGSWRTRLDRQRPTFRGRDPEATSYHLFGFRVARDLTP